MHHKQLQLQSRYTYLSLLFRNGMLEWRIRELWERDRSDGLHEIDLGQVYTHHDKLWIKLDKNIFALPEHIFLCFVYASPASSPYSKALPYEIFQELEKDCAKYSREGKLMISGDLNARTGIEKDYVMDYGDVFSPIDYIDGYTFDNPLSRNNMDTVHVDTHGEKILDLCKM